MAINLGLVGKKSDPLEFSYDWKDVIRYALSVGGKEDELDYLVETRGPKVLPSFAVVPSFQALIQVVSNLGLQNPLKALHGEQKIVCHRPIAPSGKLTTVAEIKGIYDKGKGALVVVEAKTRDDKNEPVFDNIFSIFCLGEGGFGGDKQPEAAIPEPPAGKAPDFKVSEATTREQALFYRLNGDFNPLHAEPQMAKMVGYERADPARAVQLRLCHARHLEERVRGRRAQAALLRCALRQAGFAWGYADHRRLRRLWRALLGARVDAGRDGRAVERGGGDRRVKRAFSGARWEPEVGYCRAVRAGDHIFVSGTAPVAEGGGVHAPGDGYAQAARCLDIIARALAELGADLSDIVRTRMFTTDIARFPEYARAHRERFGAHPPATSMVEVRALVDPQVLIEIEADAVCQPR
jgi:enamine deaminase RidA (YjgF/YER057c/UK114 family)/acyl dehydratase